MDENPTWESLRFCARLGVWLEAIFHGAQVETPLERGVDDKENQFKSEVFSESFHWQFEVNGGEVRLFATPIDSVSGCTLIGVFDATPPLTLSRARAIISCLEGIAALKQLKAADALRLVHFLSEVPCPSPKLI